MNLRFVTIPVVMIGERARLPHHRFETSKQRKQNSGRPRVWVPRGMQILWYVPNFHVVKAIPMPLAAQSYINKIFILRLNLYSDTPWDTPSALGTPRYHGHLLN